MSDNIIAFPGAPRSIVNKSTKLRRSDTEHVTMTTGTNRFAVDATREATPVIFPHVPLAVREICVEQLGCPEILLIPVDSGPEADPRNYVLNVAREMLKGGGHPVFGWRIRTSPLYVAAEFCAVHQTGSGLVDVTPNPRGEQFVCFAPDYDVPPDFDFLDRPTTRRFVTYDAPTRRDRVRAEMARMDPCVLAEERRRATNEDLTLEDAIALGLGPDKLEIGLDLFIECSEALEKMMMAVMDGFEVLDFDLYDFLERRKVILQALVEDEFSSQKGPAPRRLSQASTAAFKDPGAST